MKAVFFKFKFQKQFLQKKSLDHNINMLLSVMEVRRIVKFFDLRLEDDYCSKFKRPCMLQMLTFKYSNILIFFSDKPLWLVLPVKKMT